MNNISTIVGFLGKNREKLCTMHELSTLLKIPYATFYRQVRKIDDLLVLKTVGKSKVVELNWENPIIKAHLIVSSDEERKDFLLRQPFIKKIASELSTEDIVVLFGSYAKGKETEKSDIDVLVINSKGDKTISFSKYELLFKKKINPIFIMRSEFELMLKDKAENVGKQVLKNHIILHNPEKFWGCVLHAIR